MRKAVVLSGGGARCLAQVGYLGVLKKWGIEFDAFSGSSAGAIVSSLFAKGMEAEEILEFVKSIDFKRVIKFNFFKNSVFKMDKVLDIFYEKELYDFNLSKKLFVCVTDLDTYEPLYIDRGDLGKFLLASCSLIPLFDVCKIDSKKYIDGGFTDNLPITPLLGYDFILALNVNPILKIKESFFKNFYLAAFIMLNANIKFSKERADKFVEFKECGKYSILDRKNFDEIYQIGVREAKKERDFWMAFKDGEL